MLRGMDCRCGRRVGDERLAPLDERWQTLSAYFLTLTMSLACW